MREALERIYRQHRQALYTLALSITRDRQRAEDAVHEAFARLCGRHRSPNGDAVAYAFASVRHAALDQLRRHRAVPTHPLSIFADAEPDGRAAPPHQRLMESERDVVLQRALLALPSRQRQVVVMKVYGELTFDQIAKALGEPLSTVSSRYRRALHRLRECMEKVR